MYKTYSKSRLFRPLKYFSQEYKLLDIAIDSIITQYMDWSKTNQLNDQASAISSENSGGFQR